MDPIETAGLVIILPALFITQFLIFWMACTITGVSSTFLGFSILTIVTILPSLFFPGLLGSLAGGILFLVVGPRVTNADGFMDMILTAIIANIIGFFATVSILKKVAEYSNRVAVEESETTDSSESEEEPSTD